jgi:hypothetical protein
MKEQKAEGSRQPKSHLFHASTYYGMERKERDASDWTYNIKTHRWFLRLNF